MHHPKITLAVVSPSSILQAGIVDILHRSERQFIVSTFNDIQSLSVSIGNNNYNVVVIDGSIATAGYLMISNIRKQYPEIRLAILIYQYVNQSIIDQFDVSLTIDQTSYEILEALTSFQKEIKETELQNKADNLSERETEVLKLLITGYSAKEVADKLNISVNTVITHRKNISQKTGIKSLAGLTIYAVTRKIIPMSTLKN